jgi:hypothetical protein
MIKDLSQYGLNITAFGLATMIGGIALIFLGRGLNE